jgi:oxepin-CoA hydrolase/3-oxo-5,6-dehydrosuberyl-CoA semialdehyde dehydrogenase
MKRYQNYVQGRWMDGDGTELELFNAINGTKIGELSAAGLDYEAILEYGRATGGNKLRKMTFQERGRMLKALAMFLLEKKAKYY